MQAAQVLVVDDDVMNNRTLQSMLENSGVKSDKALNGFSALELVKERINVPGTMYKLLIVDYSMPELDGPSFTVEVSRLL